MSRWQKMMALMVMLSVFGLLLAACGGGQTGTQEGAASPAASPAAMESPAAEASPAAMESPAAEASPAATPGAETAALPTCPDSARDQQITMWSPLTGPDGDEMTGLANRFSQENPYGIKVQHLPQPDYIQKLNTAAAGGSLPDMTVIRAGDIAEAAARNVLKPMSEEALAAAGGADLEGDFPEQVWRVGEYKGQRYAIPLDVHPLVLYYNKDMFQQAGLPAPGAEPMSKEQFEQAAEALNKDGVMGVAIGTAFQAATLFQTLIRQAGGQIVSDDGTQATYNSEEGVQALQYLRDLKQKYSPQISGAGDPEVTAFQQGRAAMVMHGPWHISNLQRLPFTGFAPVPQMIGDDYAVWGGSHQLALTTDDPARQAAAGCWIGWLSANSVEWAKAGQLPIRESAREGDRLQQVAPPVAAFAAEADDVIMLPPVPGLEAALWGEGFGRAVDAVLLGQQTDIKQALDAAAQKSNQLIQQNLQRYGGQ